MSFTSGDERKSSNCGEDWKRIIKRTKNMRKLKFVFDSLKERNGFKGEIPRQEIEIYSNNVYQQIYMHGRCR